MPIRLRSLFRPKHPNPYKLMATQSADLRPLVIGTAKDRLRGIDVALSRAPGATVLDIGCHDGGVAEAFAKAGATRIDGCDLSTHAVAASRARIEPFGIAHNFLVRDLSTGPVALVDFSPRYDIVCYLGMHHHLERQLTKVELRALTLSIASRVGDLLLARTPAKHFPFLADCLEAGGLVQLGEALAETQGVGELRMYRPA